MNVDVHTAVADVDNDIIETKLMATLRTKGKKGVRLFSGFDHADAQALVAPARLIASNAGVEGDVIIEKLTGKPFEMGYNAVRFRFSVWDLGAWGICHRPACTLWLELSAVVMLLGTIRMHLCLPLCASPCLTACCPGERKHCLSNINMLPASCLLLPE